MDFLVPKETVASLAKQVYLDLVVLKVMSVSLASLEFKVQKVIQVSTGFLEELGKKEIVVFLDLLVLLVWMV